MGETEGNEARLKARRTGSRGFTLIELLIVVAIIGIIVAIAVVNMINAIQRGKQKRSMADIKSVSTALEAYATDFNFYPAAAGYSLPTGLSLPTATLGAAAGFLSPDVHPGDAARGRLELVVPLRRRALAHRLRGPLRRRRRRSRRRLPLYGPTTDFNADIILVDGAFVQFPEGAQH